MTIVELLLSLSLLGLVVLVSLSWLRVAVAMSADVAGPIRWRAGATGVMELVERDLAVGDFGASRPGGAPRVRIDEGRLLVATRGAGPGAPGGGRTHEYVLRSPEGRLVRRAHTRDGRIRPRPLLDSVSRWECDVHGGGEGSDAESSQTLTIAIASMRGEVLERTFRWDE